MNIFDRVLQFLSSYSYQGIFSGCAVDSRLKFVPPGAPPCAYSYAIRSAQQRTAACSLELAAWSGAAPTRGPTTHPHMYPCPGMHIHKW